MNRYRDVATTMGELYPYRLCMEQNMQVVTFAYGHHGNKTDKVKRVHLIYTQEDTTTACGLSIPSILTRWNISYAQFVETKHLDNVLYKVESKDNPAVVNMIRVHVTCKNCLRGFV